MFKRRHIDHGCCNLAGQMLLEALYDLTPARLDESGERLFAAMVSLAESEWRPFDTPQALFVRLAAGFPADDQQAPPWEVPKGSGWPALMETMRRRAGQTVPAGSAAQQH